MPKGNMGGRRAKALSPQKTADLLVNAGGKRWAKNGKDRVYLDNAISLDLDLSAPDAPWTASRSVINILSSTKRSAYYDVNTGKLEYTKSRYSWANNHIEKEFSNLVKNRKK